MTQPRAFSWQYDRSPWDSRAKAATFSIGIYQWLPKASGTGFKKSKTIRVLGDVADSRAVYAKADELCRRLNRDRARFERLPNWVQKQYSVPRVAGTKKAIVKDRVTEMARAIWGPELKKLGFRRSARKFWRNTDTLCQLVELKMDRWGTADKSRFYVRLGVFWHEVEAVLGNPSCGKMPPPEYRCTYRIDLGGAMPERLQRGWDVGLNTDMHALGRRVLSHLIKHGLPWLEFRSKLENAQNWSKYLRQMGPKEYTTHEMVSAWAKIVFLAMSGKRNQAARKLASSLDGSSDDAHILRIAERLNIDLSQAKFKRAKR